MKAVHYQADISHDFHHLSQLTPSGGHDTDDEE